MKASELVLALKKGQNVSISQINEAFPDPPSPSQVGADAPQSGLTIPGLSSSPGRPRRPQTPMSVDSAGISSQTSPPSRPEQEANLGVSDDSLSVTQPTSSGQGKLTSNVQDLRRKYGYKE